MNQSKPASPITVSVRDGVATMLLDRADQRNPLSPELIDHGLDALDALERDDTVRVVILTGAGSVFCAGAQLGTVLHPDGLDAETQFRLLRGFNRLAQRIRELDLPVIAAVNGPAVGGGAALALACDIAIGAPSASYYFAFGRMGAGACDLGCAWMLPRIVGAVRARHWLMTGATIGAEEGKAAGLFVEIAPAEKLLDRAHAMALEIAAAAPRRAMATTKMTIARGEENDFQTSISYEAYLQTFLFTQEEHRQKVRDFLESRKK
jgi:enoyl-CoA hydratase/carnithine racemase